MSKRNMMDDIVANKRMEWVHYALNKSSYEESKYMVQSAINFENTAMLHEILIASPYNFSESLDETISEITNMGVIELLSRYIKGNGKGEFEHYIGGRCSIS